MNTSIGINIVLIWIDPPTSARRMLSCFSITGAHRTAEMVCYDLDSFIDIFIVALYQSLFLLLQCATGHTLAGYVCVCDFLSRGVLLSSNYRYWDSITFNLLHTSPHAPYFQPVTLFFSFFFFYFCNHDNLPYHHQIWVSVQKSVSPICGIVARAVTQAVSTNNQWFIIQCWQYCFTVCCP